MKTVLPHLLAFAVLAAVQSTSAAVLPLDFTNGNGTSSVDQFTGVSGSGWNTAWLQSYGSDVTSPLAVVQNTTPIYSGGDNYLHVTYSAGTNVDSTLRTARVSRQWSTSSLSLSSPITMSFYFRSDTIVSGANQSFVFFGSSTAGSTTGPGDSWKISMDGGGVNIFNGNTGSVLVSAAQIGTNVANAALKFTLVIDPVADTYVVTATRLDTNVSFTSGTLALRNGGDSSLSYINVMATGGSGKSNLGYSLDGLTVVPEPHTWALLALGLTAIAFRRRRRVS